MSGRCGDQRLGTGCALIEAPKGPRPGSPIEAELLARPSR